MAAREQKTNLVAIQCYIEPYELSEVKLELLLEDQGLQPDDIYNSADNKVSMIRAVIEALYSLISLEEESDNGSKQRYNVDAINKLIGHYKKQIDEQDETKSMVRDATREGIW